MRPARAGECASEPKGCATVRVPGRKLPSSGIATRDSISLVGRTNGRGGPSAALPQMRSAIWPTKSPTWGYLCGRVFALRRDLLRLLQSFANLDVATAAYDERVTDLRRGANLENLGLEPTRIPPSPTCDCGQAVRRLAIVRKQAAAQIGRSSLGFQNGRKSSIFGQRFMTTLRPAFSASSAALSS